ncbi:hypothetical protein ACWDRR_41365 [Kitasatospora sp. NPDC003701]
MTAGAAPPAFWRAALPPVPGEDALAARCREGLLRLHPGYTPRTGPDGGVLLHPAHPDAGSGPKQLSPGAWRALRVFTRPATAPEAFEALGPGRADSTAAALVLDGVLQVRRRGGEPGSGRFLSGPAAFAAFAHAPGDGWQSWTSGDQQLHHRLAVDTVLPWSTLPLSAQQLSSRLYRAGKVPDTPALRALVGTDAPALLDFLALRPDTPAGRVLAAGWRANPVPPGEGWLSWYPRSRRRAPAARWKLYLGPRPRDVPVVLQALVPALAAGAPAAFKVGGSLHGLLRPDKIVAYFDSRSELLGCARRLAPALAGLPAHPVPFTAPLGTEGLLSWAADPPAARTDARSWRIWVCSDLALALALARTADAAARRTADSPEHRATRTAFAFCSARAHAAEVLDDLSDADPDADPHADADAARDDPAGPG